jgi:cation transport ATPase
MRNAATAVIVAGMALATAACHRTPPPSGVTSVQARIEGITCPTCVPPLQASLKRQYQTSAINVDDEKDTASVQFAKGEDFSPAAFQDAVERVRMHVVTLRVQACGPVDEAEGAKWMTAGANRFRLRSDQDVPAGKTICADGVLDTSSAPAIFQVSAFKENGR